MKKIVTTLVFFTLLLNMGLAQKGSLRFGLQFSPSFSSMHTNDHRINQSGTNLGMKLGMLTEYYYIQNYAFSTGIGFSFNQGGTLLYEYGGRYWPNSGLGEALDSLPDGVKLKHQLQYVEIPFLLKIRTREFGSLRYYVESGIIAGFRSQSSGSISGRGVGDEAKEFDIRRDINPVGLSWVISGGLEHALTSSASLVAGLNLQVGLTDVTRDKGVLFDPQLGSVAEKSRGRISGLSMKIGLMF
ncbi:MAG: outer membrane beta-barrel protein [Haliscomenobacter sp.]